MGICVLVDELNRLRKSSSDSIDSEKSFDEFKRYMHIRRNVEDDLKSILREVRSSETKTLFLLCGSAGDGKSHMLSYLKNCDEEHLLDGFQIHNDATESSSPSKTAIETLNEVLDGFSDEKLEMPGENMILAINLGVLNNFIESEFGQRFTRLKEYVESHSILTSNVVDNHYDESSHFQHASFADYQLFTLSSSGVRSKYIEEILKKIFGSEDNSPFLQAFQHGCEQCPLQKKCPVRYNYMFMQKEIIRKSVTDLLVRAIIKEKEILTTREILNYFYDITVPQDFTFNNLNNSLSNTESALKLFVADMTPNLIFDQDGVSKLMNIVRRNDPLLERSEAGDDFAVEYYVATDCSYILKENFKDNEYGEYILQPECIKTINQDREIKVELYRTLVRISAMEKNNFNDPVYQHYIHDLYLFNAGKRKKLGSIYNAVQKAVMQWCGTDGDHHVCLNSKNNKYSLYEEVEFEENLDCIPAVNDAEELQRFTPELRIGFESENHEPVYLNIDFPLYKLLVRLNNGYVHTASDRNNHADFISFVNRVLKTGNANNEVFVLSENGEHSALRSTKFGYKYEVIR